MPPVYGIVGVLAGGHQRALGRLAIVPDGPILLTAATASLASGPVKDALIAHDGDTPAVSWYELPQASTPSPTR